MRFLTLPFLISCVFSCNSANHSSEHQPSEFKKSNSIHKDFDKDNSSKIKNDSTNFYEEKNFFDFDALDHYKIEIGNKKPFYLYSKNSLTQNEKLLVNILRKYEIKDTAFIYKLEQLKFIKKEVNQARYKAINNLFNYKNATDHYEEACEAEFRDILVFRKLSSIIGIAKICFSCNKHFIIGSNVPTVHFSQYGEIRDLEDCLD